jgi:hypothetical protein
MGYEGVAGYEFLDAAFGGAGIDTYLDSSDGLLLPVGLFPDVALMGSLDDLGEWLAAASTATVMGMRVRVEPEVVEQGDVRDVMCGSDTSESFDVVSTFDVETVNTSSSQSEVGEMPLLMDVPMVDGPLEQQYCYLGALDVSRHSQAVVQFGPAPALSELAKLDDSWFLPATALEQLVVQVQGDGLHVEPRTGQGGLEFLQLLHYARSVSRGGARTPLDEVLVALPVAGVTPVENQTLLSRFGDLLPVSVASALYTDADQRAYVHAHVAHPDSCFSQLLRDVWGKGLHLGAGAKPHEVLPPEIFKTLVSNIKGGLNVTVVNVRGVVCVYRGCAGSYDNGYVWSGSLSDAYERIYKPDVTLCVSQVSRDIPPNHTVCGVCGYEVVESGHTQRCRIPLVFDGGTKLMAWEGDGLHQLDVRRALISFGVSPKVATDRAQVYVEAAGQAAYMTQVHPNEVVGLTEKQISTWFEANYSNWFRHTYLAWLHSSLVRGGYNLGPDSLFDGKDWCQEVTFPTGEPTMMSRCETCVAQQCICTVAIKGKGDLIDVYPFRIKGEHVFMCPFQPCVVSHGFTYQQYSGFVDHLRTHGHTVSVWSQCIDATVMLGTSRVLHREFIETLQQALIPYPAITRSFLLKSLLEGMAVVHQIDILSRIITF